MIYPSPLPVPTSTSSRGRAKPPAEPRTVCGLTSRSNTSRDRAGRSTLASILAATVLLLHLPGRAAAQAVEKEQPASAPAPAADKGGEKGGGASPIRFELRSLVAKVQEKLNQGKRAEEDFTAELKEFDVLLEKHRGGATDEVAQILLMKAMLYMQALEKPERALVLLKQLTKEFPNTQLAKGLVEQLPKLEQQVADNAAMLARHRENEAIQKTLVPGVKFPDFQETGLDGKPISISAHRGMLVLVDFWATWCGPCLAELPNVLRLYATHRKDGFQVVGISLDKDKATVQAFLQENSMRWPQYFDGLAWDNKLARRYGVESIPSTYLLDTNGVIIAHGLKGEELAEAVAKYLKK